MSRLRRIGAALLAAYALAACSQTATNADPVLAREQRAVAPLKTKYKDVIMGTDVKDKTLNVYVDVDNMYSMDEDAEAAMKAYALERWKSVWLAEHPHQHGALRLNVRDYYGKEIYTKTVRV